MARVHRPDYEGTYHHVVIRGVDGLPIFDTDTKRKTFLNMIQDTRRTHDIQLFAFGFLNNHWHGFLRRAQRAMSRFVQTVKSRYTVWYNNEYGRTGTLYDGRYHSSIVESDSYFQMVWHYVQTQGVKAGLYEDPVEDPGSTARLYAGEDD
ncbi:MAG: transposase [bacterium]